MGFGRKRRETTTDPNKVYEISTTTFIKVNNDDSVDQSKEFLYDQKYHLIINIYRYSIRAGTKAKTITNCKSEIGT